MLLGRRREKKREKLRKKELMDFNDLPKLHAKRGLGRSDLNANPFDQLKKWIEEALAAEVVEVNAMALATATAGGKPSCRTVLLKHVDEQGLVFYTNYESRKGRELSENPQAMVTIFWHEQMQQICVEGAVEKISQEESNEYFLKRPRGSQLGAWASQQDEIIASKEVLEKKFLEMEEKYLDREIPLPSFWGGYRIIPSRFEFWQGRKDRLHDRFEYLLDEDTWIINRLSP